MTLMDTLQHAYGIAIPKQGILVIETNGDPGPEANDLIALLREHGHTGVCILYVLPGTRVDSWDEEALRELGWVRAQALTA